MDYHAGGKWFIHGPKRRKENQLLSLKHDIIKIETGICVAFLLQVRNIICVSLMFIGYIYNHNIMIKNIIRISIFIPYIYIQFSEEYSMLL